LTCELYLIQQIFNLLLSFSIYFGQIAFGAGLPRPVFDEGIVVTSIPRVDAPAQGILRKGDVILQVNGRPISPSAHPSATEAQKSINEFISQIRATPVGESLLLSVVHPNEEFPSSISVRPQRIMTTDMQVGPQSIGVMLTPNYVKSEVLKTPNLLQAAGYAKDYVTSITVDTAQGLATFAGQLVTGQSGSSGGGQVSGPIGLIRTGSQVISTQDWATVLLFAAAISVNLGVVNAIPLPALDGGQLVFVLAEAVTGRKVDQRWQEGINGAALFFLLLLSVGAAVGDIENIFTGR
jgi:RIP metalloprotease RseP